MFQTRANQENLAYNHQAAAAAKPLNQNTRTREAKTPGQKPPKTPFRTNRRDENVITFGAGAKSGLKPGTAKNDDFVTPAPTQPRAPLGVKTTNIKARSLQTPGGSLLVRSTNKQTSPRLRRSKVKIHQATQDDVATRHHVEADVEYMPPRSIPLPDFPRDQDSDDEQVKRDAERIYQELREADAATTHTADDVANIFYKDPAASRAEDRALRSILAHDPFTTLFDPASEVLKTRPKTTKSRPLSHKPVRSAVPSKSAAAALSKPVTMDSPSFAKPTAAALARIQDPISPEDRTLNRNHAAATTTSRSTLGYSKGRAVSASARRVKAPSEAHRALVYKKAAGRTTEASEGSADLHGLDLGHLLATHPAGEQADADADADAFELGVLSAVEPDSVFDDFQLELPDYQE